MKMTVEQVKEMAEILQALTANKFNAFKFNGIRWAFISCSGVTLLSKSDDLEFYVENIESIINTNTVGKFYVKLAGGSSYFEVLR